MAGEYLYAVSNLNTMTVNSQILVIPYLIVCRDFLVHFFGGKFWPKIANFTRHDLRERNLARDRLILEAVIFLKILWEDLYLFSKI